ncbi:hypothetical protein HDU98_005050 [Podochytrium sp. JEL0797]|nr:hypothetical protein HDU98_005050 [Podochytrium sp. JEL0797]
MSQTQVDPAIEKTAYVDSVDSEVSDLEGYDPNLQYDEAEDARVRYLIDTRLMPWILLSTFILNMDRTNVTSAISDHMPAELGFSLAVINNTGSIGSVLFAIAAFSGSILGKRFGPHRFIPLLVFAWGTVTLGHAFIQNTSQFYLVRALLSITEGGVIPATIVYLGSFYKKNEIATRLSWFWGTQSLASAFSGIMASGLLQLKGTAGLNGWRWLFLVDGVITILSSFLLYFALPRTPYHTKGGLNFNGWLTERQGAIAVTRVIRDDPQKINYHVQVTLSDVLSTITDYKVLGHLLITFVGFGPLTPFMTYLPTSIASFGFNVYVANALTAPNYIIAFITMTLMVTHSDKVGERGFHGLVSAAWYLVGFVLLEFLPDNSPKGIFYFATLVVSSAPMTHPLNIAWLTENTASIGKRTVASGLVIAAANLFSVYASQIYQPSDAPRYHVGNFINIGLILAVILLWLNQKFLYVRINKQRAEVWNAKSVEEKEDYDATTAAKGSDRLDFVFKS